MNKDLSIEFSFFMASDEISKCFLYLGSPNNLLYWKVWNRRLSLLKLTCIHTGSAFC